MMTTGRGSMGHSKHRKAVKRKVPVSGRTKYAVFRSVTLSKTNWSFERVTEWFSTVRALVKIG